MFKMRLHCEFLGAHSMEGIASSKFNECPPAASRLQWILLGCELQCELSNLLFGKLLFSQTVSPENKRYPLVN